jgi:maltose alpha-D-glucosyltransferase/alpha-amylase
VKNLDRLRKTRGSFAPERQPLIDRLLQNEPELYQRLSMVKDHRIDGYRIAVHGDYHLGQVLFTGKDFFIVDFEGEPKRSLGERRLKRSPLSDVAGMMRSFDYLSAYFMKDKLSRPEDEKKLSSFIRNWNWWMSAEFLKGYLEVVRGSGLLPKNLSDLECLLDLYCLEKALYELGYEIDARPDWIDIPIRGILRAIGKDVS